MTSQQLETQVKALVAKGNIVEAIQLVLQVQKCGLKEAKDYVDKFR